jgi:hypothetical protein
VDGNKIFASVTSLGGEFHLITKAPHDFRYQFLEDSRFQLKHRVGMGGEVAGNLFFAGIESSYKIKSSGKFEGT